MTILCVVRFWSLILFHSPHFLHFRIFRRCHNKTHKRNKNRHRHGGRRRANYGRTFRARKEALTNRKLISDTIFLPCACEPNCAWKCANDLPDFRDRVADLRDLRFAGVVLVQAKRDHIVFVAVGFLGVWGGDGYS